MVIGFLFLVRVNARGSGPTPNFDTGTPSLVHVDFKVSQPGGGGNHQSLKENFAILKLLKSGNYQI